ncbi:hypothetical protein LCGC14_2947210 [marine sediment metagenome]|uniref:Uncharacterized protein n=1 Tax=marine sediment metagenome TaxID=412755 RepID=A0A0F8ZP15_9ZZZZ
MEIEKMGKSVSEALALKGKVDSLQVEIDKLTATINGAQKEIDKIQPLVTVRDNADRKRETIQGELATVQIELEKRLSAMSKEGIILPLGNTSPNRQQKL